MLPFGSQYTPRTTPYHVTELVLELMRITFRDLDYDNFPFRYSDDFDESRIAFDTVYNKASKVIGTKPIIIVSRGDSGSQSVATGDVAAKDWLTAAAAKTSVITSSVMAKVISKNPAEVDLLANDVFSFMLSCRTLLPKLTSIQSVSNVQITQVIPFAQDDSMYQCIVSFIYQMQYKWIHLITQQVLDGITIYLNSEKIAEIP